MADKAQHNLLLDAAFEVQNTIHNNGWKFCYIGGLAVLRWGILRMTQDIDLCLRCGFGKEAGYITTLLQNYQSRISNSEPF